MEDYTKSILILDHEMEFYNNELENLEKNNYQTVIIDPNHFLESESFNILSYAKKIYDKGDIDSALDMVEHISKIIFSNKDVSDPFWDNQASDLFVGTTIALFENEKEVCLENVFDAINNYLEYNSDNIIVNRYLHSIYEAAPETKRSIFSLCTAKLKVYCTRQSLNKLFGSNSFNINNDKTAIIVVKSEKYALGPIMAQMIFTSIKDIIEYESLDFEIRE